MLVLLALMTSSFALDDSSLRADDSSDLFRDPYDLLMRPGQMALVEGTRVHTLLAEPANDGYLGLGFVGEVGDAVLGAAVASHAEQASWGSAADVTDHQDEVVGQTVSESWQRHRQLDLTLSYGGRQGKHLALGAAAEIGLGRWGNSLGESNLSDLATGSAEEIWNDGELTYSWTAERSTKSRQVTGVLALAN